MSKHMNPEPLQSPPVWRDARLLKIHGGGAADFLQGYLTCDTRRMTEAKAIPMAICNVKGRVVANGWAIGMGESVGLIVHHSLLTAVEQFLKPYVMFSSCTATSAHGGNLSVPGSLPGIELVPGLNIAINTDADQAIDASEQVANRLVEEEFAFLSEPNSAKFLPQMLGLDQQGAVDFDKGCYLGQEIVARAEFRGALKRKLTQFSWQQSPPTIGSVSPELGTVIALSTDGLGLAVTTIKKATR